MSSSTFDLDVDVVPVTAPTLGSADLQTARDVDESHTHCTPGTVNTYTVGVFDCPTCC